MTLWTYTAGGVLTNFVYLDVHRRHQPDHDADQVCARHRLCPRAGRLWPPIFSLGDFDTAAAGDYTGLAQSSLETWTVYGDQVSVVADPATAQTGINFLALASGVISNSLLTVPGVTYTLQLAQPADPTGPPAAQGKTTPTIRSMATTPPWSPAASLTRRGEVGTGFSLWMELMIIQRFEYRKATSSSLDVGEGSWLYH